MTIVIAIHALAIVFLLFWLRKLGEEIRVLKLRHRAESIMDEVRASAQGMGSSTQSVNNIIKLRKIHDSEKYGC